MMTMETTKRWKAEAAYETGLGMITLIHDVDEISELEALIEQGPDFRMLLGCTITYNCSEEDRAEAIAADAQRLAKA